MAKVMRAGKGRDIQGLIVGSLRVVVTLGLEFYLSKLLYQYAPMSTSLSTPRMNITFLVIYLKQLSACRERLRHHSLHDARIHQIHDANSQCGNGSVNPRPAGCEIWHSPYRQGPVPYFVPNLSSYGIGASRCRVRTAKAGFGHKRHPLGVPISYSALAALRGSRGHLVNL